MQVPAIPAGERSRGRETAGDEIPPDVGMLLVGKLDPRCREHLTHSQQITQPSPSRALVEGDEGGGLEPFRLESRRGLLRPDTLPRRGLTLSGPSTSYASTQACTSWPRVAQRREKGLQLVGAERTLCPRGEHLTAAQALLCVRRSCPASFPGQGLHPRSDYRPCRSRRLRPLLTCPLRPSVRVSS